MSTFRRITIGIVGDYNPEYTSHLATDLALLHAAESSGIAVDSSWLPTEALAGGAERALADVDGLLCTPGTPYASMDGALSAIRTAREDGIPLLGTCGGFQHMAIEYARSVLGWSQAAHEEATPAASLLVVHRLPRSLVGFTRAHTLASGSRLARIYGERQPSEAYLSNFGINPTHAAELAAGGLRPVGWDSDGEARAFEVAEHPFYLGTLFIPQLSSSPGSPHPLIVGLIEAAAVAGRSHARRAAEPRRQMHGDPETRRVHG